MLHPTLQNQCSATTVGNMVLNTQSPHQIWPWQQGVLYSGRQWTMATSPKDPLRIQQDPTWNIL
jgi:hypothetical protein